MGRKLGFNTPLIICIHRTTSMHSKIRIF